MIRQKTKLPVFTYTCIYVSLCACIFILPYMVGEKNAGKITCLNITQNKPLPISVADSKIHKLHREESGRVLVEQ